MMTRHTLSAPAGKIASKIRRGLMLTALLTTAAALHLASGTLHSATVFEFGPSNSYVTENNIDYRRTATISGTGPYISTVAFDRSTPLSPADGYAGPTFYGGYTFSSSTHAQGFTGQRVINDYARTNNNDAIYLNVVGSNTTDFHQTVMSFAGVFVFDQQSFNTPFQEGNVSVNGFSIRIYRHANGASNLWFNPAGRWLVEIDGTYYLSNAVFTGIGIDAYADFSLSGSDLASTLWATYDPATNLFFNDSIATFGELALENITAVGFYIEDTSFQSTTGTVGMRLAISEFSVTTIPEPGPLALIAIPCLIGYFSSRWRK